MHEAFDRVRRVVVSESGLGAYGQVAVARQHVFTADEPQSLGGFDSGPDPIEMMMGSLAACTSMTIRMYAQRKGLEVGRITITVEHTWAVGASGKREDQFRRMVEILPTPNDVTLRRFLEIADRCPVHSALSGSSIETIVDA